MYSYGCWATGEDSAVVKHSTQQPMVVTNLVCLIATTSFTEHLYTVTQFYHYYHKVSTAVYVNNRHQQNPNVLCSIVGSVINTCHVML